MLILTRHAYEKIIIGDDIKITVLSITDNKAHVRVDVRNEKVSDTFMFCHDTLLLNYNNVLQDFIKITLVSMRKNKQISLGIDAPKNISVHREEIYNRIQREKKCLETKMIIH